MSSLCLQDKRGTRCTDRSRRGPAEPLAHHESARRACNARSRPSPRVPRWWNLTPLCSS